MRAVEILTWWSEEFHWDVLIHLVSTPSCRANVPYLVMPEIKHWSLKREANSRLCSRNCVNILKESSYVNLSTLWMSLIGPFLFADFHGWLYLLITWRAVVTPDHSVYTPTQLIRNSEGETTGEVSLKSPRWWLWVAKIDKDCSQASAGLWSSAEDVAPCNPLDSDCLCSCLELRGAHLLFPNLSPSLLHKSP